MSALAQSLDLPIYRPSLVLTFPMVVKGRWHDYEEGKKKEYGEFVRKAREFASP